jgi:hypothetical protein
MSATHRSLAEGTSTVNLPLFLITLPRTSKSQEIFRLTCLCHIAIRVEAYRARTGLTQCYNCQKFGLVWANCKQPPRYMWCGGGHLHKECPEKGNAASIPTCCNCKLVEERNLIPPTTEAAATPGKSCERENRRQRPRLHREGCSLPTTPPQDYPSRQRYAATHSTNSSSLIRPRLHRPAPPQWEK